MSTLAAKHGTAAFAREDIDDARRRRPDVDLRAYAEARGLEFHDRGLVPGFRMALPRFDAEMHNLVRGVLPGDRFGVLAHQVVQTHHGSGIQGTFHAVRPSDPAPFWKSFVPDRTDIPILGHFLEAKTDHTPREAFDTPGAWAPATTAATPVPETAGPLSRVAFLQRGRTAKLAGKDVRDLTELGVPGWRAHPRGGPIDDAVLARLMTGPMPALLGELRVPWAEVRVDHAMLTVRRNGYLKREDQLDRFARLTCELADALRDACLAGAPPAPPFTEPLPPCPWATRDIVFADPAMAGPWAADIRAFAARHALALEDPAAFTQLHPSLPVPGLVLAVARARDASRVIFATDVPLLVTRAVRGVLAWPVPGTPDTPPGGLRPDGVNATVSVTGGVAMAWPHRLYGYTSEADELPAVCRQAAAAAGVPAPPA